MIRIKKCVPVGTIEIITKLKAIYIDIYIVQI